jgi:hypothetical protein
MSKNNILKISLKLLACLALLVLPAACTVKPYTAADVVEGGTSSRVLPLTALPRPGHAERLSPAPHEFPRWIPPPYSHDIGPWGI